MRLPEGWRLVLGGGAPGADPLDAAAWALLTSAGAVLFDAGAGRSPDALARAVAAALPAPPAHLFLTHAHADHAGGAHVLRCAGARVHAGALTAGWVSQGCERAISLDRARAAGIYPEGYRFVPCPIDVVIRPGEAVAMGEAVIEPVATPGHSDDHLSYLVTIAGMRALVAGDALLAGGRVILQDTWDSRVDRTCATIRALAEHRFEHLLPGHGPPVLGAARRDLERALNRVRRLLPPEQFA